MLIFILFFSCFFTHLHIKCLFLKEKNTPCTELKIQNVNKLPLSLSPFLHVHAPKIQRIQKCICQTKSALYSSNVTKTFQFRPELAELCFPSAKSTRAVFQLISFMHLSFYVVNKKRLQMLPLQAAFVQHIMDKKVARGQLWLTVKETDVPPGQLGTRQSVYAHMNPT